MKLSYIASQSFYQKSGETGHYTYIYLLPTIWIDRDKTDWTDWFIIGVAFLGLVFTVQWNWRRNAPPA